MKSNAGVLAIFFLAPAFGCMPSRAAICENLAQIGLKDTTITLAQELKAGSFNAPNAESDTTKLFKTLPSFCRVTGVIKPSQDSNINFEVWLPLSGWNGKFQGVGNGGFAGSINYGHWGMARPSHWGTLPLRRIQGTREAQWMRGGH